MIQKFVDKFIDSKNDVVKSFLENHPEDYHEIVKKVVEILSCGYRSPDPERIHTINDGDYQGTLVFVIGASGYQPSKYWYVKVDYGSCSGCDTLESIRGYSGRKPTEIEAKEYWTLALHIVQNMKEMCDPQDYPVDDTEGKE